MKLDMAQAYQQLEVDDATVDAQTLVTHRGAFRCCRLQFRVCVAPGIFQSLMERLLHGLPRVVLYFDNIFVSAKSEAELVRHLRLVFNCFRQKGLKLKANKCKLGARQVEFLGFLVDADSLHPAPSKVRAILEAPILANRTELQAFLSLLNFYNIFLPHKSTVAEPLHRLLRAQDPWSWTKCQRCQENISAPTTADTREWETPKTPWSRIHLDFAGPFQGHTFRRQQ